jgi:hypothetical protein
MWSDELDNKMKEGTEGYRPAYDDKAWEKMEVLLDKHLPQEKRRRRFMLLLLPLLLVGIGVFLVIQKQGKNSISEKKNTLNQSEYIKKLPEEGGGVIVTSEPGTSEPEAIPKTGLITPATEPGIEKNAFAEIRPPKQIISYEASATNTKKVKQIASREQLFQQQSSAREKNDILNTKIRESNETAQQPPLQNTPVTVADNDNVSISTIADTSSSLAPVAKAVEDKKRPDSSVNKEVIAEAKPQKQKSSPGSKLSLNFSAGPDISSVGIDNPGKWNLQYGIGISYAVSKRLSIRTGFFAGRKKYSADSTEYYSSYYPPKLERIDANCLVYEIPVNLVYNFPVAKKRRWFIAGGLSTYLMKKETYDYYYKNPWGQPQFYSRSYKNENSHLFSIINISGGYQYHFTDRLSLLAEPYVRIPVSGIGSGKVKLNSGGVLFSIGFKPFLKKK